MRLLIEHATVWDGSGAAPFPGQVLVENERIVAVAPRAEALAADGAERLDAGGKFLMPGLVEGHAHLSFVDTPRGTALGELPPEDHALLTMDAARKLLGAGFTSACSAAAAKIRLDVAVRDAIERGHTDGPRLLTASPELTVTGGLGDGRRLHLHQDSFGVAVDGPDEVRRMARLCLREGCDTIKLNISGDYGTESALAETTVMTDAEVAAGVEAAHTIGRRVAAHARASESVKRALRNGVDIIYHCDFADEEALDMLEAQKDRVFTGPAIGIVLARLESLRGDNSWQGQGFLERLKPLYEATCRTHHEMRKRGIRIVIGGDYGFAANPQGTNARDLEHFVTHLGFSPSEALQAATRTGGEIMKRGHELGQIKPGFLADLLLVDGDPLQDVRVLQNRKRLALIMKGGVRYVPCEGPPHVRRLH
ncbi:MAG: amidohydrolase family protein [Reyranella sp.]|uniref:amidohydrolase family protein n=1 Tax=Reyranella sp. TaxID=1929291 RepID=UPI00272F1DD9|nr:amidohydrolase family protein [Reyranella sp.]MDP1963888.1 amidohydrolase family protein [Reyranella sp.]MDP2376169.1 amidohydrolase family protein [Reyranella sp.]